MAFSQVGATSSSRVLLCLPGLLETRATFDSLLQAAEGLHGLRVISVDHCGRGDSDRLAGDKGYCMSVYLQDIEQFLRQEVMHSGHPMPQIEVLGTSMGGILAMYLAQNKSNHIEGLFFNDIGLNLHWMSIYGLYDGMKKAGRLPEPIDLAAQLNVSVGAVTAVSSPSHFDLPYRKDWKGMQFGHLLNDFKGQVRLVHGSESGVCLSEQVKSLKREFPNAQVLEVDGAAHPVPFTDAVNQFIISDLKLPAQQIELALPHSVSMQKQTQTHMQTPNELEQPIAIPQKHKDTGLFTWFKQQLLGATKR
jgi:pimeloyl-ACP methyl ester carboxylesterase